MIYTSHSKISEYPPNPKDFPNFYHCKEELFILNPGDMLYIPPFWFHWVFSYGDEHRENIAIGYNIFNPNNINVFNEFHLGNPFTFNLNDTFEDLSLKNYNPDYLQNVFITKSNTIVPVQKAINKTIYKKIKIKHIIDLHNKQVCNISIGRDPYIKPKNDIPQVIKKSFPNDQIESFLWIHLLKNHNTYIETGLHYDITHNIIVQTKGVKVVRLFKPNNAKNLYLQPTHGLQPS